MTTIDSPRTGPAPVPAVPNHHAHHPGLSGWRGVVAALSMTVGRGPMARLVADAADVGGADRVVDVGCGPGAAAREAAGRGAHVTGVDPLAVMLRVARLLSWRARSVEWRNGVAEALPLDDHSATVVWSVACVHHWVSIADGLAEATRVLEPGGRLIVIERLVRPGATGHGRNGNHGWVDDQAEAFADACRQAGFDDVEVGRRTAGNEMVLMVRATAP